MNIRNVNWVVICFVGQIIYLIGSTTHAETADDYSSTMSREKFERIIDRQFQYINKRLLNKKIIGKIENSGNDQAISLLNQAMKMRDEIAEQIEAKRYEGAYESLQKINNFLSEAMKISRSKERAAKKIRDDLDMARIVNEAYFERAQNRVIDKLNLNDEAASYYERALGKKIEADNARSGNEFETAIIRFQESTKSLKKMIATIKKTEGASQAEFASEIEMFGEE